MTSGETGGKTGLAKRPGRIARGLAKRAPVANGAAGVVTFLAGLAADKAFDSHYTVLSGGMLLLGALGIVMPLLVAGAQTRVKDFEVNEVRREAELATFRTSLKKLLELISGSGGGRFRACVMRHEAGRLRVVAHVGMETSVDHDLEIGVGTGVSGRAFDRKATTIGLQRSPEHRLAPEYRERFEQMKREQTVLVGEFMHAGLTAATMNHVRDLRGILSVPIVLKNDRVVGTLNIDTNDDAEAIVLFAAIQLAEMAAFAISLLYEVTDE